MKKLNKEKDGIHENQHIHICSGCDDLFACDDPAEGRCPVAPVFLCPKCKPMEKTK